MPNWCYNEEFIYGPKPQVKELYEKLIDWSSRKYEGDDSCEAWLYKIALGAGFRIDPSSKVEGDDTQPALYFRGYLLEPFELVDFDEHNAVIRFSSDTAWGNLYVEWDTILAKVAPDCKYYFIAEEPGSGVYIKRDPLEMFPEAEWVFDIFIEDPEGVPQELLELESESQYYLEDELVAFLRNFLNMETDDIFELIAEFSGRQKSGDFGSENNFYSFNKFEEIQ